MTYHFLRITNWIFDTFIIYYSLDFLVWMSICFFLFLSKYKCYHGTMFLYFIWYIHRVTLSLCNTSSITYNIYSSLRVAVLTVFINILLICPINCLFFIDNFIGRIWQTYWIIYYSKIMNYSCWQICTFQTFIPSFMLYFQVI